MVDRMAAIFGALSHATRVEIVRAISDGPKGVNAIAKATGISQSSASQHLAILERVGLVKVEKRGTSRIYSIRGPRVARLIDTLTEFCDIHGLRGFPDPGEP